MGEVPDSALYAQIREIIAHEIQIAPDQIPEDATIESLGLDSLTMVEVVIALERRFSRSIDTSDFADELQETTPFHRVVEVLGAAVERAAAGS